jgi:hypothetical protein
MARTLAAMPLTGAVLYRVIQGFRQRAAVSVPFDPTPRWPNVRELEDKVRDAENALERAKAEAVRADREARVRDTVEWSSRRGHANPLSITSRGPVGSGNQK